MKKWIIIILIFIVALSFAKDALLKFSVEKAVHAVTGLNVKIGSFKVGLLSRQMVDIKDLQVLNPQGYADPVMAEIPEIYLDYDIKTVLSPKIFINELRLYLKEFEIVKDEKGMANIERITLPKSGEKKDIAIGNLYLKIATIKFKNYAQNPPLIREYNINLDEKFQRIENLNSLVRLVLFRTLATTGVKNFVNLDMRELSLPLSSVLSNGRLIFSGVNEVLQKTKDAFQSIFGK